jgi:hypothetical protein
MNDMPNQENILELCINLLKISNTLVFGFVLWFSTCDVVILSIFNFNKN